MGREPQTKRIGESEWQVSPWPGRHGLRVQAKLAQMLAPALGGGQDANDMVRGLLTQLHQDNVVQLVIDMLHGVRIDGQDAGNAAFIDRHMAANYGELFKGLAFVLEVNLGNFLPLFANIGDLTGSLVERGAFREG